MWEKLTKAIIKFRIPIIFLILILIVVSGFGALSMLKEGRVNSDMLEYIGPVYDTGQGLAFLKENFNINGDAMLVVEGEENDIWLKEKMQEFSQLDGVTQLLWQGSLDEIMELVDDFVPFLALFGLSKDDFVDIEQFTTFLKQPITDERGEGISPARYNYVVLIMLEYPPSSKEATELLNHFARELEERETAFAGMSETARKLMSDTLRELPIYLLLGLLAILVILLLTTNSYIEPFILIFTLGTAIIINAGTNYFFPSVSIVSFAAGAVLQLGCTMDFAIIFSRIYEEKRQKNAPLPALSYATSLAYPSIISSGVITMGALISLYFIGIDLGQDLAFVLLKAVAISLLTVLFVLPCLLYMLDKPIAKTKHKKLFNFSYKKLSHAVVGKKALIIALVFSIAIATFVGQMMLDKSYFEIYEKNGQPTAQQAIAETLDNQLIISVPVIPKEGGSHKKFIESVNSLPKVDRVLGAFTAINFDGEMVEYLLDNTTLLSEGAITKFFSKANGVWHTLYTVIVYGNSEDSDAVSTYDSIVAYLSENFDTYYNFGVLTGVSDMEKGTPLDFWKVTLISSLIITLMMFILLRSIRKSLFFVLIFQTGVWLNLSISALMGSSINFLVYILIVVVQLVSAVNYSVFVMTNYGRLKKTIIDSDLAAEKAMEISLPPILIAMILLASTCLSVYFVSSNIIVKDMALLFARGGIIGGSLSVLILPAFLAFYKQSRYPKFLLKK